MSDGIRNKIYLLTVKPHLLTPKGADAVGYHEWNDPRGFVILACSEAEARAVSAQHDNGSPWWEDINSTTCELILPSNEPQIIIADQPTG